MVEELLACELVIETGVKKEGAVGKPSKMLSINPEKIFSLAIRVLPTQIHLGIFSLLGEQLLEEQISLVEGAWHTDELVSQIKSHYHQLLAKADIPEQAILGAGVSFAVAKDYSLQSYQESGDIRQQLAEALSLPVAGETTASACAAYQMLYGEAKQLHSFIYIHLSEVVESAVVYDRQILMGQNGLMGAIGEIFVTPETDEKTAELGRLNDFASLSSLQDYIGKPFSSQANFSEYCQQQQDKVMTWIENAAEPMRIAIHTLESILNCQAIILAGDVDSWFLDRFITQLRPYIPSIAQHGEREVVRLIKTPNVEGVGIKGAATLPLHAALSFENMTNLSLPENGQLTQAQVLVFGVDG